MKRCTKMAYKNTSSRPSGYCRRKRIAEALNVSNHLHAGMPQVVCLLHCLAVAAHYFLGYVTNKSMMTRLGYSPP